MKAVLVVRHAKSSWENFGVPDFDRPLNERGKTDGPEMAKRLLSKKIAIDTFISSPAKRAKKTAALFAAEYHIEKEQIVLVPELYHASSETFYETIAKAPDASGNIALFSHNPGITDFVNGLTHIKIDNMPTCSVFAVKADIPSWKDFKKAEKQFWFYDYPKSTLVRDRG